ncbi:MAG: alkaline phosphatase [Paucibacter sp.]|nr:alkaline phosphatase [Roseateles sp.]
MKPLLPLAVLFFAVAASAAPTVTRLTPPSELFSSGHAEPVIARFLPGQRFDLQATIRPDAGRRITTVRFAVDGADLEQTVSLRDCASGCVKNVDPASAIASLRAYSLNKPGLHELTVKAVQDDGQAISAKGNFEVVPFKAAFGPKIKNIIILLGDGMGAAQRTAARLIHGYAQGKAVEALAMDTFPATALVKTASLNSIVTDSAPGMTAYVLGNKNNNNEEGVFPDDTVDAFDNPRIEYLSEYLHRTQGKALGVVTTADVFDATPAGNAVHTSDRGAGTGIVDQFFDDRGHTGLSVLMGGGRKWFLPASTPGSARSEANDYAFSATDPHTAEIARRWGVAAGAKDPERDLIKDFEAAGFAYAATKSDLDRASDAKALLGLFAFSNMNVALDKINGRRGLKTGLQGTVVEDFGLPDQPMLDEMVDAALKVLDRKTQGFVLMAEGASIDKQAHLMDSDRWMLEVLEFDRAVKRAQDYAARRGDTLVIVTADHECSGASLIGASTVSDAQLRELARAKGVSNLRDKVVGNYEKAGFPHYKLAADGYPETMDIDRRLLVGYGANADRYEDWRTSKTPQRDPQQPFAKAEPLKWYPATPSERDAAVGEYFVTGQVPGESAVHTATDVPLSAFGPGALSFSGVIDNTDVFFKLAQAAIKGVTAPADTSGAKRPAAKP